MSGLDKMVFHGLLQFSSSHSNFDNNVKDSYLLCLA